MRVFCHLITIFISLVLISACIESGDIEKKTDENKPELRIETYENGKLKYKGWYLDEKKTKNHYWFYPSGNIKLAATYEKDIPIGLRQSFYDKEDNPVKTRAFFNDGPYLDSIHYYFETGEIEARILMDYRGDPKIGRYFYKDGNLQSERTYITHHKVDKHGMNTRKGYLKNGEVDLSNSLYYESSVSNSKPNNQTLRVKLLGDIGDTTKIIYGELGPQYEILDQGKVDSSIIVKNDEFVLDISDFDLDTIRFSIHVKKQLYIKEKEDWFPATKYIGGYKVIGNASN